MLQSVRNAQFVHLLGHFHYIMESVWKDGNWPVHPVFFTDVLVSVHKMWLRKNLGEILKI